jgi:hypothetical protein
MKDHVIPDYLLAIMSRPSVLRARAAVRRDIAAQDTQAGDTWALRRNLAEASRLEGEAYAIEGSERK